MRVAVLTGGSNSERDVALAGARQVVGALRSRGHTVEVVDTVLGAIPQSVESTILLSSIPVSPPDAKDLERLESRAIGNSVCELPEISEADVVFLVLHGNEGEGGDIQAVLEEHDICYTGSGPAGSRCAMDKNAAKKIFRESGISTPDWTMWPADKPRILEIGFPAIVKPSRVGSTVGLTLVDGAAEIIGAVEVASPYDDEVMLEAFIDGREFTIGILDDRPLSVGEIIPHHRIFDYECKYVPGKSEEIFPAAIDQASCGEMCEMGLAAHTALGLRDFSRVDFRIDNENRIFCLEANTLPGMTKISLLPQSAAASGIEFAELCEEICNLAVNRMKIEEQ